MKLGSRKQTDAQRSDCGWMPSVALAQSLLYIGTGVWPLVSMSSFEAVTGPKSDRWLVKTVGVIITVIGAVLAVAGLRRSIPGEVLLLAVGSALGLASIDCIYVRQKRIRPVYLWDAVAEVILATLWAVAWVQARQARSEAGHKRR